MDKINIERRKFLERLFFSVLSLSFPGLLISKEKNKEKTSAYGEGYDPKAHSWGMGIRIDRCIGCGRCANACKKENNVPELPFFFRTWVERYIVFEGNEVVVDSPNGGMDGFKRHIHEKKMLRSFFVPKLCNQCAKPPCVQVCPTGATFKTDDGVILVDSEYCIGCEYCIQACPYGARFLHPKTRTAEKCTFCYHRLVKGMIPACVEVCPTQTRVFGDTKGRASPLVRFMRMHKIRVLKPYLNTEPTVFYAGLDMEVK
jgi:Fe-S-cluster-containing dehydrogenase component